MRELLLELSAKGKAGLKIVLPIVIAAVLFLVVVPTTHADPSSTIVPGPSDTYAPEDQFVPDYETNKPSVAKLTLTKILNDLQGKKASGSNKDITTVDTPGVGVTFYLTRVTPKPSLEPSAMQPSNPNTFQRLETYVGTTDTNGFIRNPSSPFPQGNGYWRGSSADGSLTGGIMNFPASNGSGGSNYYLLEEDTSSRNPYTNPSNSLFDPTYAAAEPEIFDLPHQTLNSTSSKDSVTGEIKPAQIRGSVYHLHLFPKNVISNDLIKTAKKVVDSDNIPRDSLYAQTGDTVSWEVKYRMYNDKSIDLGNRKLDLAEINQFVNDPANTGPFIVMADRLPSSLQMMQESQQFTLQWQLADGTIESRDLTTMVKYRDHIADNGGKPAGVGDNVSRDVIGPGVGSGNLLPTVSGTSCPDPANGNPQICGNLWTWGLDRQAGSYIIDQLKDQLKDQPKDQPNDKVAVNIWLSWTYNTKLTSSYGDLNANKPGLLINNVAAETIDSRKSGSGAFRANASLSSPGLQFVKTDKPESGSDPKGLAGAIFRLTKTSGDQTSYLYSNGRFYLDNSPDIPSGVKPVEAMSNQQGIVTFVGIPIVGIDQNNPSGPQKVIQTGFALKEYKAPEKFQIPTQAFTTVDFSAYSGLPVTSLARSRGGNGITADVSRLAFNSYETPGMRRVDGSYVFKNAQNEGITKGLENLPKNEWGGNLPLTGGRGILLILIAGAIIMLIGLLYRRHRRKKAFISELTDEN
ncbi:LPXTG cell wall anchor domain-containing protein [Bombiscardovia coagulans]|uniref:Uncharacterized protein n=1 Tax=Bombiscardovia coagulans TaxID=686666 RepID=A0A261EW82_9BIFI|nr:LPXTG cell wall anchor domain-containing protein [Bombiscardovia coagulans]OZG51087.1 hypothetical protein BOCO_0002 [Bombiscardovia coagulans]